MAMLKRCLGLLLATLSAQLVAGLVIESAERQLNLAAQRAGHQTKLVIKNNGKASVAEVTVCLAAALQAHAATTQVMQGSDTKAEPMEQLKPWAAPSGGPAGAVCASYQLVSPLGKGQSTTVLVMGIYTKVMHPLPASVKQGEKQRVLYTDSAHVISPYKILTERGEVQLGTTSVESHTAAAPATMSSTKLMLGPYTNLAPFSLDPPLRIHYENNSPFVMASDVERDVDVSPWGSVYFEDRYTIANTGAKLAGEFSRFAIMTSPEATKGSVGVLAAVVPAAAQDLYYRDTIGNVSTSHVRPGDVIAGRETVALLTPRFPLYGGWSVTFKFGWTLPLQAVTGKARDGSGRSAVAVDLAPAVQELPVDHLTLRVVLPEGASDPEVTLGVPHEATFGRELTYLDVLGRPVVVVKVDNFVPELKAVVVVSYRHSNVALLQKPLILAAVLGAILALLALLRPGSGGGLPAAVAAAVVKPHAA